jgi:hypothetical protein
MFLKWKRKKSWAVAYITEGHEMKARGMWKERGSVQLLTRISAWSANCWLMCQLLGGQDTWVERADGQVFVSRLSHPGPAPGPLANELELKAPLNASHAFESIPVLFLRLYSRNA